MEIMIQIWREKGLNDSKTHTACISIVRSQSAYLVLLIDWLSPLFVAFMCIHGWHVSSIQLIGTRIVGIKAPSLNIAICINWNMEAWWARQFCCFSYSSIQSHAPCKLQNSHIVVSGCTVIIVRNIEIRNSIVFASSVGIFRSRTNMVDTRVSHLLWTEDSSCDAFMGKSLKIIVATLKSKTCKTHNVQQSKCSFHW